MDRMENNPWCSIPEDTLRQIASSKINALPPGNPWAVTYDERTTSLAGRRTPCLGSGCWGCKVCLCLLAGAGKGHGDGMVTRHKSASDILLEGAKGPVSRSAGHDILVMLG